VLRAVLDANVYVGAVLRPEGLPGRLLTRLLSDAAFVIVISPAIVDEVMRVLAYPKLRRLLRGDVEPELWFEDIVVLADLVATTRNTSGVCVDPDDDKYLDAALEGRAEFVVTGGSRSPRTWRARGRPDGQPPDVPRSPWRRGMMATK
jgi:putative PIN family toxin of toxin-antitoxin system